MMHIQRDLQAPDRSFFLFGPRGVGKTTWLNQMLPNATRIDLLESRQRLRLTQDPGDLGPQLAALKDGAWVIIDEVQKVPLVLDEVQRLMGERGLRFALSGSSARKLKRKGVNLLAGRALTRSMEAFSATELAARFHLSTALEWGTLPAVWADRDNAADFLSAYLDTYVKEEIREEGIVRNVPPFIRFLGIAGMLNARQVNGLAISREAAVSRSSVDVYFAILVETLLGHMLPAYQPAVQLQEQSHPKFYWFDSGVARAAAGLLYDPLDGAWLGYSLETLIFHEMRVYNETRNRHRLISYYRTKTGSEIDFIIETRKRQFDSPPHVVCIEVKLSKRWDRTWERGMRALKETGKIKVDRMIGIYAGVDTYRYDDVDVLPVEVFLKELNEGAVF